MPISDVDPDASSEPSTAFLTRAAASVSPRNSSNIPAQMIAARGSATPFPAMSGAEPWTGSNNDGPVCAGFRLADAAPDAAGDRATEIGEDVAEEVVGHDHVVALGPLHEVDARRVDVVVARGDVRVLGRHLVERALPEVAGEREDVRLVHQREVPARPRLREVEREADAPLDAEPGVDRALRRDLERGPVAEEPTLARVRALRCSRG